MCIATEFYKFKDVLFNEKIIRHKIKRIQSEKNKLGTSEIDKISLSCFDNKAYVLDNGTRKLAYFHKDGGAGCKEIKKDCHKEVCENWGKLLKLKKHCDNWKNIVIIEKTLW